MIALRVLLFALLVVTQAAVAQPRFDFDSAPGRLPKSVVPERCALTLTLDPDTERFIGQVVLTLRARQPVSSIVLHASELNATRAEIDGRQLVVTPDEQTQTWTLTPTDGAPVLAGEHRLELDYVGKVRNNGSGLFQAPHMALGKPARMLATQLEAIFARAVFPAFDEPAFRLAFELTVRAPKGYEVLSNMNETSSADEGLTVLHRFAPTPPMPSYLVSIAVGHFESLSGDAVKVPLRVLSALGKRDRGVYALSALQKVLPYYTKYFGIPYALPKLDLLAVPSNRRGAMEDWGLISFAESALLFDPATSGPQTRRRIFSIVAHEVAHQWFGDLVTAASWEEIWLNEAFATWLAEKATDRFNPEWQVPLRRRLNIDRAMSRDASKATRAIRSGPVPEDRVFDVFDDITYAKGGAVLTMLERWLGPDRFREGLGEYMRDRRFSNATAGDLWFHIGKAAARDVNAVAASWTDQPGFPVVSIATRCESNQTRVKLTQQRFTNAAGTNRLVWRIPVVLSHGGALSSVLLDRPTRSLTLPGCPPQPTLVNPAGDGFYRVAYQPAQQIKLTTLFPVLQPTAQVVLLSDTFSLAQAGRLPMATYLDLLMALRGVEGPGRAALFAQAGTGLEFLARTLAGTPQEESLFTAARALLAPELDALGWVPREGEDSETEALRNLLIRLLSRFNDTATIERARALFDADEAGSESLLASTRGAVVTATGVHADRRRFEQLMLRLTTAQSEEDRWLFAAAVASTRDPALARQVLELSLQPGLPNNVAPRLPGMVADEPSNAFMAYEFVVGHWATLADKTGTMSGAAWLLPDASKSFKDLVDAQRLLADQHRLVGGPGGAAAAEIAAQIDLRSNVRARESQRLRPVLEAMSGRLGARQ